MPVETRLSVKRKHEQCDISALSTPPVVRKRPRNLPKSRVSGMTSQSQMKRLRSRGRGNLKSRPTEVDMSTVEVNPLPDQLQNLPIDIFHEVVRHLNTPSLLSLYRTCKYIRTVLESTTFGPVWVLARERMGIPPPEFPHSNEIRFASFIFETICGLCGVKSSDDKKSYFYLGDIYI
ncbi:hypothetical protein K474DRAFT_712394 [Panus rudis PR-1116 ss-1]|nr:hypothetical protein K474DRAFT_712394 [Panus rudis PR-1116 ss-1]